MDISNMSRRIIIITLLAVFAMIVFYPVGCHYQWQLERDNYLVQLQAQGEILDPAKLLPPPLPPGQNGLDLFDQAESKMDFDYSNDLSGMVTITPGKTLIQWQQPDIREDNYSNSWPDLAAVLDRNADATRLLQQIIGKPTFNFQLDYSKGDDGVRGSADRVLDIKEGSALLSAATLNDLHDGNVAEGITNIRATIALAQGLGDEPFILGQLIRGSICQNALFMTWEALQSPAITDQQLRSLQEDWTRLEFIRSAENAVVMKRATSRIDLVKLRSYNLSMTRTSTGFYIARAGYRGTALLYLWSTWYSYQDELTYLKGLQTVINTLRSAATNEIFYPAVLEESNQLSHLGLTMTLTNESEGMILDPELSRLFSDSLNWLSEVPKIVMREEATKDLTITAIALKRYKLKRGEWPASLGELTPEFLPAVPKDPVDGKPLRYRKKEDGSFLLYSIGSNNHDDGGDPTPTGGKASYYWEDFGNRDWVWPQPASAKEVQVYYSHLTN